LPTKGKLIQLGSENLVRMWS